jgi:hypothetical protein
VTVWYQQFWRERPEGKAGGTSTKLGGRGKIREPYTWYMHPQMCLCSGAEDQQVSRLFGLRAGGGTTENIMKSDNEGSI